MPSVILLCLLSLVSFARASEIELDTPQGTKFALETTGGFVTSDQLIGKHVFLFFGFTHCPDVCPLTLNRLKQVSDRLSADERSKFRFLFVSVDNERDNQATLKKLQARYGASYLGATAGDETLDHLTRSFGARYRRFRTKQGQLVVDHTSSIFYIDQQGKWAHTFAHGATVESMLAELRRETKTAPHEIHPSRRARLLGQTSCDLTERPCTVTVEKSAYVLELAPRPITVEKEFLITLRVKGARWRPKEIDFVGIDLNMGYLRPALQEASPGVYQAKLRLPVCELPRMQWRARLITHSPSGEWGHLDYALTTTD